MQRNALLRIFLISIIVMLGSPVFAQKDSETEEDRKVLTVGLNHLGLTVKNLNSSTAFFTETLGWKEVGGYEDYPSKFVTDGNIFLTLWQANDPENMIAFDRKNNAGLHHLALTVKSRDALDELHKKLVDHDDVLIEFAPELNGDGPTIHMMIREPSGLRLEFAWTPPSN